MTKAPNPQQPEIIPFIPANQNIMEITVKGTILSIILAMLLAAANTYLGLKIGITITGAIPAAIISMALLRLFKSYSILENNIVQTHSNVFTMGNYLFSKFPKCPHMNSQQHKLRIFARRSILYVYWFMYFGVVVLYCCMHVCETLKSHTFPHPPL